MRPPPFVFHVKFSQSVELKPGAQVRMAGVPVGEVEHVAISQQSEDAPPTVDVQVSITNPKVGSGRPIPFGSKLLDY
jgi:ABC-type transporter Mla subunit MlaD